jgi:hypothetical protein
VGICLDDLVQGPILDLEDQQAHLAPEQDEVRLPAFDVGEVPGGELVVGLGDRFEESVEPTFSVSFELLDAPGNHRGHTGSLRP